MGQQQVEPQQVAEALQSDPFFIDESVVSSLNARLLDKSKAAVEELDFDVYVIGVDAENTDRDLLQQIKVLNGGEGSFIMINDANDLAVDVDFEDDHELEMQVVTQLSNARGEWNDSTPSTTKLNILLDLYAHPETEKEEDASVTGQEASGHEITQESNSGSFAPLFLGVAVLVLALVIAAIYLARRVRTRAADLRRQQEYKLPGKLFDRVDTLQRNSLRETINSDTSEIATEIDRLQMKYLDAAGANQVQRALDAYQMARTIVEDENSERIDLAGAMVLLRQAGREITELGSSRVKKRGYTRSSRSPQSLCTINPLHGEALTTTRVDREGAGVRVPVCRTCQNDLREENQLQWIFDGDLPYVEGTSVWAQTLFGAIGADLVSALHRQGS